MPNKKRVSDDETAIALDYEVDVSGVLVGPITKAMRQHGLNEEAADLAEAVKSYGARTVTLKIGLWPQELLEKLAVILKDERRARIFVKGLLRLYVNPIGGKVKALRLLPHAMQQYLVHEAIDGWVYQREGDFHCAYVVRKIEFHEKRTYPSEQPEHVTIHLEANRAQWGGNEEDDKDRDMHYTTMISIRRDDMYAGKTAAGILFKAGLIKETQELKAVYLKEFQAYSSFHPKYSFQFLCSEHAIEGEHSWSSRYYRDDKAYTLPHPTRMVQEEQILNRKLEQMCGNWAWHPYGIVEASPLFARIPLHPYLFFFDLERHVHCWVHTSNCKVYIYNPSLKDKLVLPRVHRDLIDTLTVDLAAFTGSEDIIAGKSGGTTLLCYGRPGLGKTLTAEIYSEIVKRPLYRVQAGQLGVDIESVEQGLKVILRRAERWGAVVLLDEADVYIRKRGDDTGHNAIVTAFLRVLEYFHGLLFMTTNRVDDVDDAIASRCIAMFKYDLPDAEMAVQLWTILAMQLQVTLSEERIQRLVSAFPNCSGRDIRQLLDLTKKYCAFKKVPMNLKAFKTCAMFRGIIC